MTLDILAKFQGEKRAQMLSAIALATSPASASEKRAVLSADEHALLAEIEQHVGVSGGDRSPSARARVDGFIADAIGRSVLGGRNIADVLASAGQAGRLPPSMYEVKAQAGFLQQFAEYGVRESDATSTIALADDVEHLPFQYQDEEAISLFVRFIKPKQSSRTYALLAHTHRKGTAVDVHALWRIYPSDIDLRNAQHPMDALRTFVEAMGIPITVGGVTAKLVSGASVPNGPDPFGIRFEVARSAGPIPEDTISTFSISRRLDAPVVQIRMAYAISKPRYRAYLQRHNVALRAPRDSTRRAGG